MRANDIKRASAAERFSVILLMFMFISAALIIITLATGAYQNITKKMNGNYTARTSLSYVASRIRQNDKKNQIQIGEIEGANSLVIDEKIDGVTYQTWIYAYDGGIYEMFAEKDTEFSPQDGMFLMDISEFEIKKDKPNLYSISISDKNGKSESLKVAVRT